MREREIREMVRERQRDMPARSERQSVEESKDSARQRHGGRGSQR